ncbi:uncharacterized protein LOC144656577 isoform X2 [Oculina patagonica]
MLPRTVHVLEMSQSEVFVTDDAIPDEENQSGVQMGSNRQKQVAEIFRPILTAMKLAGQYFGETALADGSGRRTLYISHFSSAIVVLGQWLMVVLCVTSLLHIGFSSMSSFFFLLLTTAWYVQSASSTTVCLFVLPLTGKRRSRFAKFVSSFATTATEIDGMKRKVVKSLAVACLAAGINFIVICLLSVRFNGVFSMLPPWNRHPIMHLTVRVMELVFAALNSFAWTLPPLIFCVTCMLLERMFETLQKKMSKDLIHSLTITHLRQEHLKLCAIVELANAVFSPLLFVIISLDMPLLCVKFYQLIKMPSETIVVLCYVYWCFCMSTLVIVIFIFGNRVNEKAHSFYETLQKSGISVEDTKENSELMLFLAHLRGEPIGLSVGGIAVVDKSLFLTLFGIIASYFVVLLTLPT